MNIPKFSLYRILLFSIVNIPFFFFFFIVNSSHIFSEYIKTIPNDSKSKRILNHFLFFLSCSSGLWISFSYQGILLYCTFIKFLFVFTLFQNQKKRHKIKKMEKSLKIRENSIKFLVIWSFLLN